MSIRRNEKINYAAQLRRNATPEERKLWQYCLRNSEFKFRRQAVVGIYIADFYCPAKKLAIEIDGSQHYYDEGERYDKARDEYFENLGIRVVRYSNLQVNTQFNDVCEDIYAILSGKK